MAATKSGSTPIACIRVANRYRKDMGDLQVLADSIQSVGLLHPIVVTTDNVLVAGERRLEACKLLGWTEVPVRAVALNEIVAGEYAENEVRKDFTPSERVAILEALSTYSHGGDRRSNQEQNIALDRDEAAKRAGFGNRETARQAMSVVEGGASELVVAMDEGKVSISAAAEIASQSEDEQREIVKRGEQEILEAAKQIRARRANIALKWTGDSEWNTPTEYIEAARRVMDGINLDPASNAIAQHTVRADKWYGKSENGLVHDWKGRVYLNPPYAYPLVEQFVEKLCNQVTAGDVTAAILLTNNNTDTKWWHLAITHAAAVCFTAGRIRFYKEDDTKSQPTNGQTFFYFGHEPSDFAEHFARFGKVVETC